MGKPVTVDSDDLEKVLMSTGMIKTIEQVLKQSKGDPFINKDADAIGDAHDNISKAWRNATRGICHPKQDEPLSSDAFELLKALDGKIVHIDPMVMKENYRDDHGREIRSCYPELFIKLMIEYGISHEIVYWGGSNKAQKLTPFEKTLVRITSVGQKLLLDMATAGKKKLQ